MSWIYVLLSSLVEGFTEFLPISSTGHLIILDHFFKNLNTETVSSYNIFIQAGAILAVIHHYKKELLTNHKLLKNILFSFIPTAVVGLTFYSHIKEYFLNDITLVAISLIFGGFIIFILPKNNQGSTPLSKLTIFQSIIIGLVQSISIIPGSSRALATIVGGLVTNLNLKDSIKYSFLLAVPTILSATLLDLYKSREILLHQTQFSLHFLAGFVLSFLFAKFVVSKSILYISNLQNFYFFGYYRIVLGLALLLFL